MELYAIFVMTAFAIGLCVFVVTSSIGANLYSIRNLFMAVWLYYGFSVGIDLLTGVEIPHVLGERHLMDPQQWGSVAFVMWNYVLCGVAFLITYNLVSRRPTRPLDHRYDVHLPPGWFMVALHVLAAYAYISIFFGMSRMERAALASQSTEYKFACLMVPLVLVLDILVITTGDAKQSRLASLLMVPLALVTGHRTYVLFAFLIGVYRWRPPLRTKMLTMIVMCGLMVFVGKTAYAVGLDWLMGERVSLGLFYNHLQFSFSDLDASPSYMIAVFYTQEPSPLWFGQSYTETPFYITWPRFLGGSDVVTLAESYVWKYHADFAHKGGGLAFSAIAEGWLNFGYFGAIVVGTFWGAAARFFDNRPRGIAFYIFLLMIVRLFRSDFATLYKNWVLVWGAMFFTVMVLLIVYTLIAEARAKLPRPHAQVDTTHA